VGGKIKAKKASVAFHICFGCINNIRAELQATCDVFRTGKEKEVNDTMSRRVVPTRAAVAAEIFQIWYNEDLRERQVGWSRA